MNNYEKHIALFVATLTILLIGCANGNSVSQPTENADSVPGSENSIIAFLEYTSGKNLDVTISLPEGWKTENRDKNNGYPQYPLTDLDATIDAYNEQSVNVGANTMTQVYYSKEFSHDAGYGDIEWYNKGILA